MRSHAQFLLIPIYAGVLGCGSADLVDKATGKMVFVDTETMAPIVQPVSDLLPATNPETGERTLMPGLYCPECQTWYPVPPPDQINRRPGAALCPKTRTPLISDGPRPEEDTAVSRDGS